MRAEFRSHQLLVSLTKSGVRTSASGAYSLNCPKMLRAFSDACVKLGTALWPGNNALETPYGAATSHCEIAL